MPPSAVVIITWVCIAGMVVSVAWASATIGVPGCKTRCGNVSVPYPFGMGPPRCYMPGFNLTCNGTVEPPELTTEGHLEIVDISLEKGTVRIIGQSHAMKVNSSDEFVAWGAVLKEHGPYALATSAGVNEFVAVGCNVQATMYRNKSESAVTGCVSLCSAHDTNKHDSNIYGAGDSKDGSTCSGVGCCSAAIVFADDRAYYDVELKRLPPSADDDDLPHGILELLPVHVLITETGWLNTRRAFNLALGLGVETVPVILDWACPHNTAGKDDGVCASVHSVWIDKGRDRGYSCRCQDGYAGNPYLAHGCMDIDECARQLDYGCFAECTNTEGSFHCRCPPGTQGNHTTPGGCVKSINARTGLIISISIAVCVPCLILLIFGMSFLIMRKLKRRKATRMKQNFFHQNRGQLLQQLVSHRSDVAERMIIPLEELEKATNNFDQTRELGGGSHGIVYKGILSDLHVVAIKKSKIVVKREIDEFLNEVAILSQINHRNVVKLFGCCLETQVPLLAYEFISNGTLHDHLHKEPLRPMPWEDRLRIASEIGKALAYLHSAVSIPIIHRDIKSSNILLDDALTAKVADFGASRYVPIDQTGLSTAVQGTIGYLDPMYYYTGRLTEFSDVYSFGVILVELLTRKMPVTYRSSKGDGLVVQFLALITQGGLLHILDPQVMEEGGGEVEEVARLAASCIKLTGEERPTMRQVELALECLRAPKERVQDDLPAEKNDVHYTAVSNPSTSSGRTCFEELTKRNSLEEE
ncbi:wall-associated receptor kinase 2-like [Lolium rigidum]|uniref:wall-associated receptor kinase 2-like n=1 Tax=Lolium rigidum TaxID=89674 RepID=UPI001F5D0F53|nr:wall-associated receptor kinase 2-like [Lolium rigidum]